MSRVFTATNLLAAVAKVYPCIHKYSARSCLCAL